MSIVSVDIDARAGEVYQYARQQGEIRLADSEAIGALVGMTASAVRTAVLRLVELRLLDTDGDRLVPVDPWSAQSRLLWPAERVSYRQRELTDRVRQQIDMIGGRCDEGTVGTIDGLADPTEIRGMLKLAADVCREELVVLSPDSHDAQWDTLFEVCATVLDHGAEVRVVLPHRSRATFACRARLRQLLDRGARLRTLGRIPHAAAVFDRSVAVMFDAPGDRELPAARRVREPVMIRFLLTMFDQLWEGGTPLVTADAGYAGQVTDDLHRSIARLMAEGFTDEAVARRLGMSVRTCRRHIAALLSRLGAVSRFQAGVLAARQFSDDALVA